MKDQTLKTVMEEVERFTEKVWEYEAAVRKNTDYKGCAYWDNSRERASVKRASMDLTRALADLRQGR